MKKKMSEEELNNIPKDMIIKMYVQLSDSFDLMNSQMDQLIKQDKELNRNLALMKEQIAILTQNRFGRKTEKSADIPSGQMTIMDILPEDMRDVFNEAEATAEDNVAEPDMETITYKRKKTSGKRDRDLEGIEVIVDDTITLPEAELKERFPYGYNRLPDEIYRELEFIPSKFLVHEKHIAVYAGKKDTGVIRANRPERLLKNSLLTPSLAAGVIDAKYVNHLPLNRLSEDFKRKNVNISKQVLAGWMIKLADRYLSPVYKHMRDEILKSKLIHCDETPFKVINNGRGPGTKDYMWVYHSYERYGSPPIYIYGYHDGRRNAEALKEFLGDYKGILMTDGYNVYHTVANERGDTLKVAGCWAHVKRGFAIQVKSQGVETPYGTVADEGNKRIAAIYHVDNMCKDKSEEERLKNRQASVKPLVDAYFAWTRSLRDRPDIDRGSNVGKVISYSLNQEKFLREFLNDPIIPLDNNDAERSIRSFCVGKHSWNVIGTKNGATSSAILYSIAETAKANNLKTFEYFQYLMEQILIHLDDDPRDYMESIMPWSKELPENCFKTK